MAVLSRDNPERPAKWTESTLSVTSSIAAQFEFMGRAIV
jgi:hypothetical protein